MNRGLAQHLAEDAIVGVCRQRSDLEARRTSATPECIEPWLIASQHDRLTPTKYVGSKYFMSYSCTTNVTLRRHEIGWEGLRRSPVSDCSSPEEGSRAHRLGTFEGVSQVGANVPEDSVAARICAVIALKQVLTCTLRRDHKSAACVMKALQISFTWTDRRLQSREGWHLGDT